MARGRVYEIGMTLTLLIHGARGKLALEGAMPGMKITLDAAMRVRDVSQPGPDHEAAALAADALAAPARLGGSGPAMARPGPARPDHTRGTARPDPAKVTARPDPARDPVRLDTAAPDAAPAGRSRPSRDWDPAPPAPRSPALAVPGSTSPGSTSPGSTSPGSTSPGSTSPGSAPSSPAAAAPAAGERAGRERRGTPGTGGKRHRSRKRFNR
jgi:hypothetical protein